MPTLASAPTIFHEPWWLEAVAPGKWEAAEVVEHGRCVAWLPYVVTRSGPWKLCSAPVLAHVLGPVLDEGSGHQRSRSLRRIELLQELAGRLPRVAHFWQTCHPDIDDVLGFQASAFDTGLQYSAEIARQDAESAWGALRDKTRNVIRRAQECLQFEPLSDPSEFAYFYARNLSASKQRSYFDTRAIPRLFSEAARRAQIRLIGVRDSRGLMAAVMYLLDRRRVWYFLSTRRPDAHPGAVSLLVWKGIEEAARSGRLFDFDGIISLGAARFYTGFGATPRPRIVLHRSTSLFGVFRAAQAMMRGRNHFQSH